MDRQASQPKPLAWEARAARKIAHVMDNFHVDPIMGFVLPGLGDALGGMVGITIIGLAWRHGVHRLTLARMLLNVALDTALGAIPVVGDLFDWFFRANSRNALLLERATLTPQKSWIDGIVLAGAALLCLAAMMIPVALFVWLVVVAARQ